MLISELAHPPPRIYSACSSSLSSSLSLPTQWVNTTFLPFTFRLSSNSTGTRTILSMQPVHSTGGKGGLFKQCWLGAALCALSPFYPTAPSYTSTLYPSFLVVLLLLLLSFTPSFYTPAGRPLQLAVAWAGGKGGHWRRKLVMFFKRPSLRSPCGSLWIKGKWWSTLTTFWSDSGARVDFCSGYAVFFSKPCAVSEGFVFF